MKRKLHLIFNLYYFMCILLYIDIYIFIKKIGFQNNLERIYVLYNIKEKIINI